MCVGERERGRERDWWLFQAAILLLAFAFSIVDTGRSIFTLATLHPVRGDGSVHSVSESLRV